MDPKIEKILSLLLPQKREDICGTLNDYFSDPAICQFLDNESDECEEFILNILKLNYGLTSILERVRHVKREKRQRTVEEIVHDQSKKNRVEPVNFWIEE